MPEFAQNSRKVWIQTGAAVVAIAAIAAGLVYWMVQNSRVYVDSAVIEAPMVNLAPTHAGELEQVFVNEGDEVPANAAVAQVGTEIVKTKAAGVIVKLPSVLGAQIPAGSAVAQMIDPSALRVVGKIDEDKGLSRVAVGDPVAFTADAFGGKTFHGIVDEVAPTSVSSGVVFNISDARQTSQFEIKVRFDPNAYPELKNGMSARMWIYTQ